MENDDSESEDEKIGKKVNEKENQAVTNKLNVTDNTEAIKKTKKKKSTHRPNPAVRYHNNKKKKKRSKTTTDEKEKNNKDKKENEQEETSDEEMPHLTECENPLTDSDDESSDDDEFSDDDEDEEEGISDLPGLQERDRYDSESENENNNNSDRIKDRSEAVDDAKNKSESSRNRNKNRLVISETWKKMEQMIIPEWNEKNTNIDMDTYDGDSEKKTTVRRGERGTAVETVSEEEKDEETRDNEDKATKKHPQESTNTNPTEERPPNEIKAMLGRKFTGDEVKPYGDAIKEKEEGTLRISGFNNNSINLDEIQATCQDSLDLQIDVQCFQEVCRDMNKSSILQRFLKDTKKSDPTSKSVWGSSTVNVGGDYKPGGTAIVAFGKTARRVIKQGTDDLGRWTWMALEGADNTAILIMSIYQSCRNPTNPQGRTAHHQQEVLLSERNRTDTDPRRNFYRDICNSYESSKRIQSKQ